MLKQQAYGVDGVNRQAAHMRMSPDQKYQNQLAL